jgi:uncharacterized membrane-anchored protein
MGEGMKSIIKSLIFGLAICCATASHAQQTDAEQQWAQQMQAIESSLHPISGDVSISEAKAVLHLGSDYYFLPAADAKKVLVEAWQNPPASVENVLGLIFPTGAKFTDDTWGAVITYEATGFVTDEDAKTADYDSIIADLQSGEEELNAERTGQGYPAQHLVGWAQPPLYNAANHSVVWAQNIRFEGEPENTLNYDLRMLSRYGVLSMNLVTGMSKLSDARSAAAKLSRSVAFEPGSRYADYQPGTDKKAEYGIAGLVAAGAGAAAAKKLGLLAVILAFGKKFLVLILAGLAAIGLKFRRFFGGKSEEDFVDPMWEEELQAESAGTQAAEFASDPPQKDADADR